MLTLSKINEIIIHCTDTESNIPIEKCDLYKWHVVERGFEDIGYHYLITIDGRIVPCRSLKYVGAHTKGHNKHSIGICYAGGRFYGHYRDTRNDKQLNAMYQLIEKLCADYPISKISGHCDYASRICPCFNASKEYSHLIRKLL